MSTNDGWTPQEGEQVDIVDFAYKHGRAYQRTEDEDGWYVLVSPTDVLKVPNGKLRPKGWHRQHMSGEEPNQTARLKLLPENQRVAVRIDQPDHLDHGEEGTVWGSTSGLWRVRLKNGAWARGDLPGTGLLRLNPLPDDDTSWVQFPIDIETDAAIKALIGNTREPDRTIRR